MRNLHDSLAALLGDNSANVFGNGADAKIFSWTPVGCCCGVRLCALGSGALEYLSLPDKLRGGVIVGAIESEIYDLEKPQAMPARALEVLFQNRADFAVRVEKDMGYPFLNALYRRRVIREARILKNQWSAFDVALAKPALRTAMEKKHGMADTLGLKQAMLWTAFQDKDFLSTWIAKNDGSVTPETLLAKLAELSRQP